MKRSIPGDSVGYAAAVMVVLFICASSHHASAEPSRAPRVSAYADPVTGELIAPPELGGAQIAESKGAGIEDELEILPGQTSAGGVMVDLRGHFALGLRASAAGGGRVTTHCEPRNAPASGK